nr:methylenetetrahydrofolate reductase [uncultured Neokomagataea sp.]
MAPAKRLAVATHAVTSLCRTLRAEGVTELHIYTLNKAEPTHSLCQNILSEAPASLH